MMPGLASKALSTVVSPQPPQRETELVKVLLLGDSSVGKSSIMMRFVDNVFDDQVPATLGVDFKVRTLRLKDQTPCKVQIWDTGGQERFRSITSSYYRGAHLILLVFDVTRHDTFEHVEHWLEEVGRYASEDVVCVVLGNKMDCEHPLIATRTLSRTLNGNTFYYGGLVSALNGTNIDNAFQEALTHVVQKRYNV